MQAEVVVDLVQENVDALARFQALFRSHRFHVIACPGVDPHQSTDLKTLHRLMTAVLAACASRGMVVPKVPEMQPPAEVQAAMDELIALLFELADEAGAGGGAVVVEQINRIIEALSGGRHLRRVK